MDTISVPLPRTPEKHHAVPQCLLRLHDATNGAFPYADISPAWLEFETEAQRWGVPVQISRHDLARLVEASTVVLEREKHRHLHANDWQRWGRRGGRATLRKYGTNWYSALALRRWGRISAEDLQRARVVL